MEEEETQSMSLTDDNITSLYSHIIDGEFMAQLHLDLPDELVAMVRERAKVCGLSVSRYLAEILQRELVDEWPDGFFEEIVGGWKGDPLKRPHQGNPESRS